MRSDHARAADGLVLEGEWRQCRISHLRDRREMASAYRLQLYEAGYEARQLTVLQWQQFNRFLRCVQYDGGCIYFRFMSVNRYSTRRYGAVQLISSPGVSHSCTQEHSRCGDIGVVVGISPPLTGPERAEALLSHRNVRGAARRREAVCESAVAAVGAGPIHKQKQNRISPP